jgi:hypothetical protein
MTVAAAKPGVHARQRKFRLFAVIKLPEGPAIGVVAARALLPETAFVNVLGPMTCQTLNRRIAIRAGRVAFLTGHADV